LVACASPASAEDLANRIESPVVFLPADIKSTEQQVSKGEDFAAAPLRWAFAGSLAQDVRVVLNGETVTLKAGEVLPQVLIPAADTPDGGRILLCTRNKVVENRKGGSPFGQLLGSLRDSLRDAQHCVEDTDKDGKVDLALVLGKDKAELRAAPITPTAATLMTDAVIPGDGDLVTFSLVWVTTNRTRISTTIYQRGTPRMWNTLQSGRYSAQSPFDFQHSDGFPTATVQLGIEIVLLASDKKAQVATLRWRASARPGDRVVIPRDTNVTYRY
jgi:hypothetical protein